jgi:transposase-like protein
MGFQLRVIKDYLSGARCKSLTRKYYISSHTDVLKWIHQYQAHGLNGIKNYEQMPVYTFAFKLKVLKWKQEIYASLNENPIKNVTLVGCWAHARRKFDEALKALPDSAKESSVIAKEGRAYCNQLFKIEQDLKAAHASDDERYQTRLNQNQPIIETFSAWLQKQHPRYCQKAH